MSKVKAKTAGANVKQRIVVNSPRTRKRNVSFTSLRSLKALGRPTGGQSKVASNAYRVFGFAERDMGIYLGTMGQLSAATTNDFPEAYLMSGKLSAN